MHSYLSRLNAVFFFALTCLGTCGFLAGISSYIPYINPPDLSKNLLSSITNINLLNFFSGSAVIRPRTRRTRYEIGSILFDGKIDLSDEFNWNTKELFIWMSANYNTKRKESEISLWDRIISEKDESIFELENEKTEYDLIDIDNGLKNNNITYILKWDIHPWIGLIKRKMSNINGNFNMKMPKKPNTKTTNKNNNNNNERQSKRKKKKKRKNNDIYY